MSDNIKVALTTFFSHMGRVNRGDLVRDGHPVMRGNENLFGDMKVTFDHNVEAATANPGEVRSLSLRHLDSESEVKVPDNVSADMSLNELKALADELELPDYGTKPQIAERINKKLGR